MNSIVAHVAAASVGGDSVTTSNIDTSGSTGLMGFIADLTGLTTAISDSKGNTWSPLTVQIDGSLHSRLWYVENATVGSGHNFTATGTGTFPSIYIAAIGGMKTSSSFDQQNGNAVTGTSNQVGSVTPSEDNELIMTGLGTNGTITAAIDSGFTILDSFSNLGNNFAGALAYKIQTTAAAVNPTWSGFSDVSAAVIATFRAGPLKFILIPGR